MTTTQHPIKPEELMAYLDGELPAERAAELAKHVEQCMECQVLVSDFGSVSGKLVEWQIERSPDQVANVISEAAEKRLTKKSEMATSKSGTSALGQPPRRFLRWALGLSAAGAVVLVLFAISMPNLLKSRSAAERAMRETGLSDRLAMPPSGGRVGGSATYPPASELRRVTPPDQPMIARTASLSLVAKEFSTARAAIQRIARQHQGYVAKLDASEPAGAARTLSATLRIPAGQLDQALNELKKQGRVVKESLSGEEVTRQYTDLNARLANARVTEQRLNAILSNRTGKVSDVLQVEQEISRVRGQIERMEAERKNLENRVSYATIELTLSEDYKAEINAPHPSTGTELWNAAVNGYHGLAGSALGLATGLLTYGPTILFWLALLFWPARVVWRRMRA